MRILEKKMIQAVNSRKNFRESNTEVYNKENGVFVFLHKNLIFAEIDGKKYYSNCGWNTKTTGSRLRALGADYSTNYKKNNCDLLTRSEIYNIFYSCK